MEYILIIWVYTQNRVIEISRLDSETCLEYEIKARQWPGSPITACQKKPPAFKPGACDRQRGRDTHHRGKLLR